MILFKNDYKKSLRMWEYFVRFERIYIEEKNCQGFVCDQSSFNHMKKEKGFMRSNIDG